MFRRRQSDFSDEIRAHLEAETERLRSEGMSRQDAEAAALRAFGNVMAAEERFYESRRWMFWERLRADLLLAARLLRKDPRFSAFAVLGLALGIGVSTTFFTAMSAVLLRPPDMKDPATFVGLYQTFNGRISRGGVSYSGYLHFRDHATVFAEMGAESTRTHVVFRPAIPGGGDRDAVDLKARFVSSNFLSIRGLAPAIGRGLTPADENVSSPPVAVLNHTQWRWLFGGDPRVLGSTLEVNGQPVTIVGVAPPPYQAADGETVFYFPLRMQPLIDRQGDLLRNARSPWLTPVARLKPGITMAHAQAEAGVLVRQIENGDSSGVRGITLSAEARDPELGQKGIVFGVAILTVSTVLLIACSNLANLLLARAFVRRREVAIRLALGASRGRLIAQLLTESLLLAVLGGALGLVLSLWLVRILAVSLQAPLEAPVEIPAWPEVSAILYTLLLSVAAGLCFGLAPALQASRSASSTALKSDSTSDLAGSGGRRGWSTRSALVIAPVALSVVLLGLAILSLRFLQAVNGSGPSLDAPHLLGMSLRLNLQGYDEARTQDLQRRLVDQVGAVPGVVSAALTMEMPLYEEMSEIRLAGGHRVSYNIVSAGFFQTAGVPVLRGRGFIAGDTAGSPAVAVVSESLARLLWPAQEAIGQRLRSAEDASASLLEVVGVAADLHDQVDILHRSHPTLYIPPSQAKFFLAGSTRRRDSTRPLSELRVLVRTHGLAAGFRNPVRQAVHVLDAKLYTEVWTLAEDIERMYPLHSASTVLGALGALAALMASLGIYGVLTYSVSRRTREIGIRMALGAGRREILSLMLRNSFRPIAWGLAAGIAGTMVVTRLFSAVVLDIGGLDAITLGAPALLLGAVAAVASYLPSRKAMRVDPLQTVRSE